MKCQFPAFNASFQGDNEHPSDCEVIASKLDNRVFQSPPLNNEHDLVYKSKQEDFMLSLKQA